MLKKLCGSKGGGGGGVKFKLDWSKRMWEELKRTRVPNNYIPGSEDVGRNRELKCQHHFYLGHNS